MPAKVTKQYKPGKPFIQNLPASAMQGSSRYLMAIANVLAESVRDMIKYQLALRPPTSEEFTQWKKRHGFDTRTLVMTKEYMNSIIVFEAPIGNKKNYYAVSVGVVDKPHSRAKVAMSLLAKWLEYGTKHMPARPHWRVVWEGFRVRIPMYSEKIRIEVMRELYAKESGVRLEYKKVT